MQQVECACKEREKKNQTEKNAMLNKILNGNVIIMGVNIHFRLIGGKHDTSIKFVSICTNFAYRICISFGYCAVRRLPDSACPLAASNALL